MKILRSAIVTAGAAATILMGTTPASAQTALGFSGTAHIGCFGCGEYGPEGNSACLEASGSYQGDPILWIKICAEFTVTEPTGVACVVSGSAQGSIHGSGTAVTGEAVEVRADFAWTRVGATAVVSVPGVGTGTAAFKVTEPVGNPCGGAVTASFAGVLAGA